MEDFENSTDFTVLKISLFFVFVIQRYVKLD